MALLMVTHERRGILLIRELGLGRVSVNTLQKNVFFVTIGGISAKSRTRDLNESRYEKREELGGR